jgi:hypothetical protein
MKALSPAAAWLVRIVGLIIFGIAFALPAVGVSEHDANPLLGWKCASIAFSMPFSNEATFDIDLVLVMLSGWLNVFVGFYLLFSFFKRLKVVRWGLIALSLVSMVSTWVFFGRQHYHPLIGHFLWIAGALIIMLPEILGTKQEA